jgi:adenine phosphoribosyltransferase
MNKELLLSHIKTIPNFPVPGVMFRDVTTLYQDAECLREMTSVIADIYKDCGITKVVGIESRGFILGASVACALGAGFVPIRKPGKLPREIYSVTYMKEYGPDSIEIHRDALEEGDVVLLHDDLLATGGTTEAALQLIRKFSPKTIYANFIIELAEEFPDSRKRIDVPVRSLLQL